MSIIVVASSQPGVGRSVIAAALAYRAVRAGKSVTLARLAGDAGAADDASTFASLDGAVSPGKALSPDEAAAIIGDAIIEAPAGSVKDIVAKLRARVVVVGGARSPDTDAPRDAIAGTVLTCIAPADVAAIADRAGVLAVLTEDRVLAAPSVADIAKALSATLLAGTPVHSIDRVMIGTVSSDAASPYFGNRDRTCVITRFDKTDIQLAALQTDLQCLVITGGGEPSPYLIDRVKSSRDDVALLVVPGSTVESMTAIGGLYGTSRFDGESKLLRAVELLDAAGVPVEF